MYRSEKLALSTAGKYFGFSKASSRTESSELTLTLKLLGIHDSTTDEKDILVQSDIDWSLPISMYLLG